MAALLKWMLRHYSLQESFIHDHEFGLCFRDGEFRGLLDAGRHWLSHFVPADTVTSCPSDRDMRSPATIVSFPVKSSHGPSSPDAAGFVCFFKTSTKSLPRRPTWMGV